MTTLTDDHRVGTVDPSEIPGHQARFDAAVRVGAAVALGSSLLLVSYWWASAGGIEDLLAWASGLTSAGRLTGLLASDLLLLQVLLIARIPFLERAFGQDQLLRAHRTVGLTSFNLMLAHILLTTWGYAAGRLGSFPAMFWQLVTQYPGMLLAVAGTACLVMTVVTSVTMARRRLRYESWHLLHLYAYLGVGLALPHQLWTGQAFLSSPAASVFWWGLWATAAASILVWRLGVPLWRNLRHRVRVTSVVAEGEGVVTVYMAGHRLHRLPARAGQFFGWRFLGRHAWTRGNPYSLSAAPDGHSLRITVSTLGDNSARLRRVRQGTPVLFEGPYGRLTARARTRRRIALIGAGVGMAPLRALAEELDYAPGEAVVLHRFTDHPLFERELRALARERGLEVVWLPGHRRSADSWIGDSAGAVDDVTALRYWIPDITNRDVYVCGPQAWSDSVTRSLRAAGVVTERLHIERFRW